MDSLKSAAKTVEARLASDRPADLLEFLRKNGSYQQSVDPTMDVLIRDKTVPLPDVLYEQYDLLQCRCFLGLFPEINRAWITIDHRLFLWNYESMNDFQVFEDQDQVIVSVGLIKPRPDVFLEQINYVMVVATPVEIILVAVAFEENDGVSSLSLYQTDMSISSDNISMTSIIGTENGRIFTCGNNGHLYEIQYQSDDGWFTRKCRKIDLSSSAYSHFLPTFFKFSDDDPIRKIVLDESRQLLYTLSEQSNIELIYLGPNGDEFRKISKLMDIFQQAQKWLEGINMYSTSYLDPRTFQLVSIHVIPPSESNRIELMALSSSGYRLFFSCQKYNVYNDNSIPLSATEPQTLSLVFVKPPPPIRERYCIHESCYTNGTLLASNALNDEIDSITCISPERTSAYEFFGFDRIEGKTWAIAESKTSQPKSNMLSSKPTRSSGYIVLTNAGVTIYQTRKPVEFLLSILNNTSSSGNWPSSLNQFLTWFGPEQVCAMCLSIICSKDLQASSYVVPWARRLFFELGGKPSLKEDSRLQTSSGADPLGRPLTTLEYIMSGRHDGIVLFLSRELRSLWKQHILKKMRKSKNSITWTFSYNALSEALISLKNLDLFIKENPSLTNAPTPGDMDFAILNNGSQARGELEAWQEEQLSMRNLHALLQQILEGLSFLLLLMDFQFLRVIDTVDDRVLQFLLEDTFESFITSIMGREVGKHIFSNVVQMKIGEGVGIESVCEITQQQCPSFCCADDMILYKGMECITKSEVEAPATADQLLTESLNLFISVLSSMTFEKLLEVCDLYAKANDNLHAILLILAFCQSQDPIKLAVSFYREGFPANDHRKSYYQARKRCYDVIQKLIINTTYPGPGRFDFDYRPSVEDIDRYRDFLILKGLEVDDELFHYFIFDWFFESGWVDKLLNLPSQYMEEYLGGEPPVIERFDILWRFYVKKEQFLRAARVLFVMATVKEYPRPFIQRLELLQLASTNAKSSAASAADADFVRDLEDKKDVAYIQMEIITALQKMNVSLADDPIHDSLVSISDLFSRYTQPYNLHELSLAILYTSDHKDIQLVHQIWNKIIKTAMSSTGATESEKLVTVEEKVKSLGLKYHPNEMIFPLGYLCSLLESIGMQGPVAASLDAVWVVRLMRCSGVPYGTLFHVYSDMFETKAAPWRAPQGMKQLVKRIFFLLSKWLEEVESTREERTRFPAKMVDEMISKMILTETEDVASLKSLQDRIRRFF